MSVCFVPIRGVQDQAVSRPSEGGRTWPQDHPDLKKIALIVVQFERRSWAVSGPWKVAQAPDSVRTNKTLLHWSTASGSSNEQVVVTGNPHYQF